MRRMGFCWGGAIGDLLPLLGEVMMLGCLAGTLFREVAESALDCERTPSTAAGGLAVREAAGLGPAELAWLGAAGSGRARKCSQLSPRAAAATTSTAASAWTSLSARCASALAIPVKVQSALSV